MHFARSVLMGTALCGIASWVAAAEIDVMTQNQYVGADLTPVLDAATTVPFSATVFNTAVVDTLKRFSAARPAERIKALAAGIAQRNPDVAGLQEAYKLECMPHPLAPATPGMGCDDPAIREAFIDQLAGTETALRGKYVVAGKVTNLKVSAIPFVINGYPALLGLADRDAILVRAGTAATAVNLAALTGCRASDQGCNYVARPPVFSVDTPAGTLNIAIERGYLAVDLSVKGRDYRVFNTHLEQRLLAPTLPETRLLQVGQAYELLGSALGTWDGLKKVIVVGDLNSAPGDTIPTPPYPAFVGPGLPTLPPYQVFAGNGFIDAWMMRAQPGDGLSCCQAEDLSNRRSSLYERIDMIFSLTQPSRVLNMRLLGNSIGDKTRPNGNGGLWPSDHAAVAAKLQFD